MFAPGQDDISNIHRRWSFATIGPSSSKVSYAIWLLCAIVIIVVSHAYYLQAGVQGLAIYLPLGLAALVGSHFLDYLALHGTPVNKLSKVAHVSAFANGLWALTILIGVAADFVFAKPPGLDYIIAGMLLAVGLRIGIFTSVFGAGTGRAIAVSFIQPVIFFFAFVPPPAYHSFAEFSSAGFAFGVAFVALGIVWTILADRAGRPGIKSTFGVLQAFIAAWTEHKVDRMEEFTEAKAHDDIIATKIIQFGSQAAIVLPDVHPGPFSTVGGSNLPYVLYETFNKSALVMHSVSDHSLNIPSKREVDKYVKELGKRTVVEKDDTCSAPVQIRINNSTSTGIMFGRAAVLMLSLSPKGMEDIPQSVRTELDSFAIGLGFSDVLVVDCHNAMGKHLDESDKNDLVSSAKQCLERLKNEPQHEFKIGFAGMEDISQRPDLSSELGQAGLAALVVNVNGQSYAIGWADSNNMENSLRDRVVAKVNGNVTMLELCSSDTHSTSGKRTREGYFALGTTSSADDIAEAYSQLCAKAAKRASRSIFELASAQSTIKVMGKQQFEDYSSALDRSMNVTKIFVAITVATYIAMLVLY
jgi:putative membrane protein